MNLLGALLTYGVLLLCFVAAAVVAIFLGIQARKRKDAKTELERAKLEKAEAQKEEESK